MKNPFCLFVISVFLVATKGQCPLNVENSLVSSCGGPMQYGRAVLVDFYKTNHSCTCIVTPSFVGELLVTLRKVTNVCHTQVNVQDTVIFKCPLLSFTSHTVNVQINQAVEVRAEYALPSTSGTFYYCVGFQQNGGLNGNVSVKCEFPADTTTRTVSSTISTSTSTISTSTSTISTSTSTTPQLSHEVSSTGSSTSVVNTKKDADVTTSSNPTTASYYSLPMETTQDTSENMMYIIAGSAAGGALILVCLIVFIIVLMNRSRNGGNKNRSSEGGMAHRNEVFDNNAELPDNPLYLSSQPMDELGYSSDQEKQLGLPPTDSKTKKTINSNYDVPPNNKPIDHSGSSMPVYAVPKRSKDRTPEVSTGDVYAEVCKPNRTTLQDPVRKRNEDGLLYMEVEQDTVAKKQTNTNTLNTEMKSLKGVCYAEIKHT